jgi:hypothetical protein
MGEIAEVIELSVMATSCAVFSLSYSVPSILHELSCIYSTQ